MTISKFFTLATVFVAAFTFGSCSKDDDDEKEKTVVENNPKFGDHEYVDLGLPSGTLWATCNVGASKPEEYGDYFAWGETQTREKYSWNDYKWGGIMYSKLTKYCIDSSFGTVDNRTELLPEDDAATANWGSSWRTPSSAQINELCNPSYTTTEWTALNGVNGLKITSKKNGKSLFLPAAGECNLVLGFVGAHGYYWSRSLFPEGSCWAYNLNFYTNVVDCSGDDRMYGRSVRPILLQK